METERTGTILGHPCDLDKIPIKSIRIVEYNSDSTLPHGCVVALPSTSHNQDHQEITNNPIRIFSKLLSELSDAHLTYGTFLFTSNYMQLKTYSTSITANTLFFYLRFEHRNDCVSFLACAKEHFNICLYTKKISPKHFHQYRKYEENEYHTHDENLSDEMNDNCDTNVAVNDENEYEYSEEEENKAEEKNEEATPPPGTCDITSQTRTYNGNITNIMQTIIDTPHGVLPLSKLLQIKFFEYTTVHVPSIPIVYAYPNILYSKGWFGQFGTIIDIKIYNGEHSQRKCVQIKYDNELSAQNTLSYCNSNCFGIENIKLNARLGIQKYCPFFLTPNATCMTKNCPDIHVWKVKAKNEKIQVKNNKEVKNNNNDNLRGKMRIIASNFSIISLEELPNIFHGYFSQNINHLYPGNLTEMIKYFNDIFYLKYNKRKTKIFIISKIHQQNEVQVYNNVQNGHRIYNKSQIYEGNIQHNNVQSRHVTNNYSEPTISTNNYTEQNYNQPNNTETQTVIRHNWNENENETENDNECNMYESNDSKQNEQNEQNGIEENESNDYNNGYIQDNSNSGIENKLDENSENMNESNEMVLDSNEICKNKFTFWLCNICKLGQYLSNFEKENYNEYSMIEFFDEDTLRNDLNIQRKLHVKLLLKRVNEFEIMLKEFKIIIEKSKLNLYKQSLRQYGILTINDLRNDVKTIQDVKRIFNINSKTKAKSLLETINNIV